MRFEWDEKKIEYYMRASMRTGFHKNIAEKIVPFLKEEDEIVDIGCGPGVIDFELSPYVKSIKAIDIEPEIIEYLKKLVERSKIDNIFPVLGDASEIEGELGDVTLMCFFSGEIDSQKKIIDAAKRLAIIITHGEGNSKNTSKISGNTRKRSAEDTVKELDAFGCNYDRINLQLDFGQPLKSLEEAKEFLEMYSTEDDPEIKKSKIEESLKNLTHSNHVFYPYSIPNMKDVSIFIVSKQQ